MFNFDCTTVQCNKKFINKRELIRKHEQYSEALLKFLTAVTLSVNIPLQHRLADSSGEKLNSQLKTFSFL